MGTDNAGGGGFLARVAKLVKPGPQATSWNDLDAKAASAGDNDVAYSKQALKEMMERKRHNDFVRKREFEMLRKLRRRAKGIDGEISIRPSFFVSSMSPSRPASEREQTLKKIDEIEEQMSKQWWQAKHGQQAGGASAPVPVAADTTPKMQAQPAAGAAQRPAVSPPVLSTPVQMRAPEPPAPMPSGITPQDHLQPDSPAYAKTAPVGLTAGMLSTPLEVRSSSEAVSLTFEPTGKAPIAKAGAPAPAVKTGAPVPWNLSTGGFSPSKLFSMQVEEVSHDPDLEEAAILFANADDAGTEQALRNAIAEDGPRQMHEGTWLTLFDFYRVVGDQDKFEDLSMEFVTRFNKSAPQWFSLPAILGMTGSQAAPKSQKAHDWRAPAVLEVQSISTMQAILAKAPQPWRIDWSNLERIDATALKPFLAAATQWANAPVELHFIGIPALVQALAVHTVSGDKSQDPDWWNLRLVLTRVMQRDEDFEMLALEFCVTYEVSPPAWERTQNRFKSLDADAEEADVRVGDTIIDSLLVDASMMTDMPGNRTLAGVELSGQIHGDANTVLERLEERRQGHDILVLDCAHLMRIDFSAAGNLLNWVIDKRSQGILVQFSNVHRLVAALFHALDISSNAKVSLRND